MPQVQGRGSLHAHIILWVHDDDIDRVASEITAHIPAPINPATGDFCFDGMDTEEVLLAMYVLNKQQHRCMPANEAGCRASGHCRYHFPQPLHRSRAPALDPATNRYRYYSPREVDRNTVPYHPMVRAACHPCRQQPAASSPHQRSVALLCWPAPEAPRPGMHISACGDSAAS